MAALLGRRRTPRDFKDRINYLELMRDEEIVTEYRLTREMITDLCQRIEGDIAPRTGRSHAIPCVIKLLVTLNFLARGDFYFSDGLTHGISKSSVCRCVWEVVDALNRHIGNINFPQDQAALAETKRKFFRYANIPNCIGAVDGTLIEILAPRQNEAVYVCRKGYHSINVQAVVDADMRFTDVVAKWPGSTHDSTIFNNSGIQRWLEHSNNGWLVGDSGYALRPYLLTPKINPHTRQEELFNIAHSRTRMVVERAFGMLKSRFRCLHKTGGALQVSPERAAKLFVVCCKLHNLCIDNKLQVDCQVEAEGDDHIAGDFDNDNHAIRMRQNLINRF